MIEQVVSILEFKDYELLKTPHTRYEMCFDILARHRHLSLPYLIIKIVENIDKIKPHFIHELKLISNLLSGIPIIVAKENRRSNLEDGIVYIRDNLYAINIETFRKVVENPELPLAIAKKGGFFVNVNGDRISNLRESNGLSRKEFADLLEITPKAVSQYETNQMRASVENARKMEDILGDTIIIPLNFFKIIRESHKPFQLDINLQRKVTNKTREFISSINEIVEETGYKVFWTRNTPFDLFIYQGDENNHEISEFVILGGTHCESDYNKPKHCLQREFIRNIPQDGAIIYDEEILDIKKVKQESIPYLIPKELKTLDDPEAFKKLIKKRDNRPGTREII